MIHYNKRCLAQYDEVYTAIQEVDHKSDPFGILANTGAGGDSLKRKYIGDNVFESWVHTNEAGELHRDDDEPALIEKAYLMRNQSITIKRTWCQNGLLHRDNNKPVATELMTVSNNRVNWETQKYEETYAPAINFFGEEETLQIKTETVTNTATGELLSHRYKRLILKNDKEYRQSDGDQPAEILYNDGMIHLSWYRLGRLHRHNAPALIYEQVAKELAPWVEKPTVNHKFFYKGNHYDNVTQYGKDAGLPDEDILLLSLEYPV